MDKARWAAIVGGLLFAGSAFHEWSYKGNHPHAYGPAVVLAVMGVAGALVAGAVIYVIHALTPRPAYDPPLYDDGDG